MKTVCSGHIWESEAKCSLSNVQKFCWNNASKWVFGLNRRATAWFEWYIVADDKSVIFIKSFVSGAAAKEWIVDHTINPSDVRNSKVVWYQKLLVFDKIYPSIEETYAAVGAEIWTKKIIEFSKC